MMKSEDAVKRSRIVVFLVTQLLLSFVVCIICGLAFNISGNKIFDLLPLSLDTSNKPEQQPLRTVVNEDNSRLNLLWSQSNVPGAKNYVFFEMAATNGVLFYIGSKEQGILKEVKAVDGKDGTTVLWHTSGPGSGSPRVLYATPSAIYIGGVGAVAAYDILTGGQFWSKSFPFQRNIIYLQVINDLVYVEATSGSRFLLQADSGEGIVNWKVHPNFREEYFQDKILTVDTEFSLASGHIDAIDENTGSILWQEDTSSNVVVTQSEVYAVMARNNELKLVGFQPRSGEVDVTIKFEPYISHPYPYPPFHIAVDEQTDMLYVFLGDSNQLFAFKIEGHSGN